MKDQKYIIRKLREVDRYYVETFLNFFPLDVKSNLIIELYEPLKNPYNRIAEKYVVEINGKVIAYFVVRVWGGVIWLDTFIVEENYRGKGIGSSIVEYVKNLCITRNLPQITLCTFKENSKIKDFYIKLGFISIGTLQGAFASLGKAKEYFKWTNTQYSPAKGFKQNYYDEDPITRGKKLLSKVMRQLRSQKYKGSNKKREYFMIPSDNGVGDQPLFWIPTLGCSYARSDCGGCTMCNFGGSSKKLSDEILLKKFVELLEDPIIKTSPIVNYGGQGNFFDDQEHSPNLRKKMLEEVAKRDWIKGFVCESRPEFITKDKIKQMHEILGNKIIEIGVGLESTNPLIREGIINKNFCEDAYHNLINYAREFIIEISVDVMFKPNVLTEKEAIEDVVKTIKEVLKDVDETHPIKRIILMIINIKPNTLIEWAYKKGLYQPPLLWSVVEILRRLTEKERKFVKVLGFDSGGKPLKYITNGDETTEELVSALKTFGSDHDFKPIEELFQKYSGSPSFKEWESRMKIQTEDLSKRLGKFYKLLKEEFKL